MSIQNLELEQTLIGMLLRHPDQVCRVELEPHDLADDWLRAVFVAMRAVVSAGQAIDPFAVAQRLGGEREHLADLVSLMREVCGALENLPHYVTELRKAARGRRFGELLDQAKGTLPKFDPDRVRAKLITRLAELEHGQTSHEATAKQAMSAVVDHLVTVQEASRNGRPVGVPCGLTKLDTAFGGMHRSDLIVVAGRPGSGKTALAVGVAMHAARQGYRVGFLSTEMSALQLGLRLITAQTGIATVRLRTGELHDQDYPLLTAGAEVIASMPIRINDRSQMTTSECALQARAWSLSGGLDLLIVDYLQRLSPDAGAESRTLEVGKMAVAMKDIARTLDIPVLCLAQLNRGAATRSDKRPCSADLRDSGMIEQEADQVLLLHRPCLFDDQASKTEASIIVDKNRHGECLEIGCRYEPVMMRWTCEELESTSAADEWRKTSTAGRF